MKKIKKIFKILLFIITLPIWITIGIPVGIIFGIQLGEDMFIYESEE